MLWKASKGKPIPLPPQSLNAKLSMVMATIKGWGVITLP